MHGVSTTSGGISPGPRRATGSSVLPAVSWATNSRSHFRLMPRSLSGRALAHRRQPLSPASPQLFVCPEKNQVTIVSTGWLWNWRAIQTTLPLPYTAGWRWCRRRACRSDSRSIPGFRWCSRCPTVIFPRSTRGGSSNTPIPRIVSCEACHESRPSPPDSSPATRTFLGRLMGTRSMNNPEMSSHPKWLV